MTKLKGHPKPYFAFPSFSALQNAFFKVIFLNYLVNVSMMKTIYNCTQMIRTSQTLSIILK